MQIVEYANIQFTKDKAVLEGMGCQGLRKSSEAIAELARKGMVVKEAESQQLTSIGHSGHRYFPGH